VRRPGSPGPGPAWQGTEPDQVTQSDTESAAPATARGCRWGRWERKS